MHEAVNDAPSDRVTAWQYFSEVDPLELFAVAPSKTRMLSGGESCRSAELLSLHAEVVANVIARARLLSTGWRQRERETP